MKNRKVYQYQRTETGWNCTTYIHDVNDGIPEWAYTIQPYIRHYGRQDEYDREGVNIAGGPVSHQHATAPITRTGYTSEDEAQTAAQEHAHRIEPFLSEMRAVAESETGDISETWPKRWDESWDVPLYPPES